MPFAARAALAPLTVNEVIARHPGTVSVFEAFGIDSCCGGALPVEEAARRHQIDPDTLLTALAGVAAADARGEDAAGE